LFVNTATTILIVAMLASPLVFFIVAPKVQYLMGYRRIWVEQYDRIYIRTRQGQQIVDGPGYAIYNKNDLTTKELDKRFERDSRVRELNWHVYSHDINPALVSHDGDKPFIEFSWSGGFVTPNPNLEKLRNISNELCGMVRQSIVETVKQSRLPYNTGPQLKELVATVMEMMAREGYPMTKLSITHLVFDDSPMLLPTAVSNGEASSEPTGT
jgi:hypothetical protein